MYLYYTKISLLVYQHLLIFMEELELSFFISYHIPTLY